MMAENNKTVTTLQEQIELQTNKIRELNELIVEKDSELKEQTNSFEEGLQELTDFRLKVEKITFENE